MSDKKEETLEEVVANIKATMLAVSGEINDITNKAAKARTRRQTQKLRKLCKSYRKLSLL